MSKIVLTNVTYLNNGRKLYAIEGEFAKSPWSAPFLTSRSAARAWLRYQLELREIREMEAA